MRRHRENSRLLGAAVWLLCALSALTAPSARAIPSGDTPASGQPDASSPATQWNAPFAIGDFDGDSQPDLATVQGGLDRSGTRYWIRLEFSTGLRDAIRVTAPSGGLHITSRDVNGDHFLDLIVTTAWQHRPVAVLLNDGHGKFTLHDPASFSSATLECNRFWAAGVREVKDAVAAILTRPYTGTSEGDELAAPTLIQNESVALQGFSISIDSAAGLVFGRAPPHILHV